MITTVAQPTIPATMRRFTAPSGNGAVKKHVVYPEDDGQPMSSNTQQFDSLVDVKSGYEGMYRHDPNVFVAGDLLWYPVEGDNTIRNAPDVMLVFGRPKGDRGSYMQWLEGGIAPQIVFEIISPGNRLTEMAKKRLFYERYGVEEYYEYDPERGDLAGWHLRNGKLELIDQMNGWVSPRTGVRFELNEDGEMVLYRPDGRRFETYLELLARAEQEATRAEQEAARAEQEAARAQQAEQIARQERDRAERLVAQLRALGIDPNS